MLDPNNASIFHEVPVLLIGACRCFHGIDEDRAKGPNVLSGFHIYMLDMLRGCIVRAAKGGRRRAWEFDMGLEHLEAYLTRTKLQARSSLDGR